VAVDPKVLRPPPAWAHKTQTVRLTLGAERSVAESFDTRAQLLEAIHRYCWAFDERRTDLLEEIFTADAQWEALVMGETTVGPFVDRPQVLEWLTRFWRYQKDQRRHMIVNFIVESLDENSATALSYLLLAGSKFAKSQVEVTGFYRLGYAKEAGTWKIRRLFGGFDAPFWKMDVGEMNEELRTLFGITRHDPSQPA
jgi:hypothetical protein